ncbi:Nucleotide-binding protein [Entamoeba marina]
MTELNSDQNYCGVSKIKNILLVLSGKGGVGKSTISSSLACSFAAAGSKVGLLDVDLCGPSIPKMMGVGGSGVYQGDHGGIVPVSVERSGVKIDVMSIGFMVQNQDAPVIWRGPKKGAAIEQFLNDVEWGEKDVLIVDTPPGTSDEHITLMQYFKEKNQNTKAVVVTTPQLVSLNDVEKELDFCKTTEIGVIGIIENMSGYLCPHCSTVSNIFSKEGGKELAKTWNLPFIGAIPIEPKICVSAEYGKDPFAEQPSSEALKPISDFVAEFVKKYV